MDIILWLSFFATLAGLYVMILKRIYHVAVTGDEIVFATTTDGWKLPLYHYIPKEQKHPTPVLLMHGLGANHYNFDFGRGVSLAKHLRQLGFDVWVGEMRGRGLAQKVEGPVGRFDWGFDDYTHKDVPAMIDKVAGKTGVPRIDYVGHSMGGALLYTYLISHPEPKIRRGVTVGSPIHFIGANQRLINLAKKWGWLLNYIKFVPQRLLVLATLPIHTRYKTQMLKDNLNPDNMNMSEMGHLIYNLVVDMTSRELQQFLDWIGNGGLIRNHDGSNVFGDNIDKITTPILFISGEYDLLVPAEGIRYAYEHINTEEKKLVHLSVANGFAFDYGHGDMLLGNAAPKEVFPQIVEWFEKG